MSQGRNLRRPGFRGQSRTPITPQSLGASLKLWLRADLGYNSGAKTWTDQVAGRVFTSGGTPSQVAEPLLGGQAVIQFGTGGSHAFISDTKTLTVAAPWCWLVVFRVLSGASNHSILSSGDNQSQIMFDVGTSALYARTNGAEFVGTSAATAPGTAAVVGTYGSGLNVARMNGQQLTHAALTGAVALNGAQVAINSTVDAGQTAEVILASVADVRALAPYIKARYGLTY